jgi:hypothetical protein
MFDPRVKRKPLESEAVLRNWEADIQDVALEPCDRTEDPLGYHVVYHTGGKLRAATVKDYVIGASHLVKRLASLKKAGYDAPMTQKAIALLEKRLGTEYFHA